MPPLLTQVARLSDGLPLVATITADPGSEGVTNKQQQEAKDVVKSLTHQSPGKMSIVSGKHTYYYMVRDNLCYLTMTEVSYPKRMAFAYLDEVADAILSELVKEFQSEWRQNVDQTARPFRFIHYDPIIQRKQREYRDARGGGGGGGGNKIQDDLSEIQNIMKKNIDEILNRGEKLDHVSSISSDLQAKSKDFKWGAKKLSWQAKMQQYGPVAAGGSLVAMVLYWKFFL